MGQNVGQRLDPHRDPHAERAGKVQRVPDGKICFPARHFFSVLHDLLHEIAHGLGGLVLLLPGGVGVGAQGKPGVKVPQHGGHRFHVHAVLESRGGEGVPEIVEPEMPQSGVLQDLLVEVHHAVRVIHLSD